MLDNTLAGFFYARDIFSHCGCLPNLFALGDETASVIYPTERQPFFLSALDKSLMQMKALISTASRSRKSVTLPGAATRAKSSNPALGSFAVPATKMMQNVCRFKKFAYLCSDFQTSRAEMLANSAGKNFAPSESYSVPTPVWSVNAPTARDEWKSTGKRSRFSVFSRDYSHIV
ncbi:hypothetical protein HDR58_01880 [bacterium]|nr:hypothetical protein [bacterium]